jgi:TMEM199 family protein
MVEALDEIQSLQSTADGKMGLRTNEGNKQALGNEGGDRSLEQIVITREQKNTEKAGNEGSRTSDSESKQAGRGSKIATSLEPSLNDPKVGNPISHGQAIDLSRQLKTRGILPCSLDVLLRGAKVYVPPSPPKTEPVRSNSTARGLAVELILPPTDR